MRTKADHVRRRWMCALGVVSCALLSIGAGGESSAPGASAQDRGTITFVPDRRPVRAIPCFNGDTSQPYGLHPDWAQPDVDLAIAWLEERLESGIDEGYTRFVLTLPAGVDSDEEYFGSSQWWPLAPARRAALGRFFRQWLDLHPEVTVGLYTGFDLDPTPEDVDFSGHRVPSADDPADVAALLDMHRPWFTECGFTEIFFDATSRFIRRNEVVPLLSEFHALGVRVGGEAMPRLSYWPNRLSETDISAMSWVALVPYFEQWDPDGQWQADPLRHELFVAVTPVTIEDAALVQDIISRGFIPWVIGNSNDMGGRALDLWVTFRPDQIDIGE